MDMSNAHPVNDLFHGAHWFTSTFTATTCVEVAFLDDGDIAIRDTKDRSKAPHVYNRAEWDAFLKGAKDGEFDLRN